MPFYDPDHQSKIFLYALSTCVHCRAAKKLLAELGCEYDQVNVDQLPEAEMQACLAEMSRYNPAETFPTLIGGGKVIVGCREEDIRQLADKMKGRK
ncbi:MAG: glutaredoxin family protein [Candidatus Adiutrix sp.]|jgi:glutaredoxin|nr:glutaredoxin family protein [Candidatus Adiutrix sp.]